MQEQAIQQAILARLGAVPGLLVWRNNTGATVNTRGQLVRFGVAGSADVLLVAGPSGRFCAIEVKSVFGRASARQLAWGRAVVEAGGVYIVARSVDEAVEGLRGAGVNV
ncbi:MAG: VRR-NUC domain-containing protein [Gammaproteobacteria bacterium]|nr:VRR-NUC domain-containing protein [Gammaproteobacteria bacterium]